MSNSNSNTLRPRDRRLAPASGMPKMLVIITVAIAFLLLIIDQSTIVEGFIKFGYVLNTTACDTCDELRTYSGRNVFCCLAQSKCCGPNSLDELDALTTTSAP